MKKIAAALGVFFLFACDGEPVVDDTATIAGLVSDSAGVPLMNVRITTTPPTQTVMTSTSGSFLITQNVIRGLTYEVTAAAQGFVELTDTVFTEKGENRLDFTLETLRLCSGNEARCANDRIERCNAATSQWTPDTCTSGQVCDDSAGARAAVCADTFELRVTIDGNGTAVSTPAGLVCSTGGGECMARFPRGRMITLNATPFALASFSGFSGACTGTTCALTMDGNKEVTVSFEQSGFLLNINRMGRGRVQSLPAGVNCGTMCSAAFPEGEMVELTADPDPGAEFGGWGGACSGTQLTCMVTMSANRNVDASFGAPQEQLTVSLAGSGAGVVTSDPPAIDCGSTCTAGFDRGQVVRLIASPMSGSNFTGFSGACTGTADCELTMDMAHAVTATFDGNAHQVVVTKNGMGDGTITSAPSGINCGPTCTATFGDGQLIELTAVPTANFVFLGWGGDCASSMTMTACPLTVAGPLNVSAGFERFFFGPLAADASCTTSIHFDGGMPYAQACGGGTAATPTGMYTQTMSRSGLLRTAVTAGGATEEGQIALNKAGPLPGLATIEMSVRKVGAAFNARTFGVLYSDLDANDPATSGVRVLVHNDGRFAVETRDGLTTSTAETAVNTVANNTWYHLAATLSSSTGVALFVDGVQVASTPGPLAWTASSSTAWAGAEREGAGGAIYRFNGGIDEIRVSNVLRY